MTDAINERAIRIWRFKEAPAKYSRLSQNGGDEDWVAFIPEALSQEWLGFLDDGTPFGYCRVEVHEVDGGEVRIGCHA